jgi:Glycosyltransferases involved in cell wall biogenesis
MDSFRQEVDVLFSIVIPAYNVEQYLEKCLIAIQQQTFANYEVLVINDGSKDKSGQIADSFAVSDKRIRVIHKENEGVSPTRTLGIKEACGEYLFYIDSDDWLANSSVLSNLSEAIERYNKPDIVVFNSILRLESNGTETDSVLRYASASRLYAGAQEYTALERNFPNYLWTQIYRTDFVRQSGLEFYGELYEDTLFNLQLYVEAKSFVTLDEALYIHIKRPNSLTTSKVTLRHLHLLINMISKMAYIYEQKTLDQLTLGKRLLIEYESLQKIVIALLRQGVSSANMLVEFDRQRTFSFPGNCRKGLVKRYGMTLLDNNKASWINKSKLLFKLGAIEKKIKRYVSKG